MRDDIPETFTNEMRVEIRRRLHAYRARNGNLGAPTLLARIQKNNPNGFQFSRETLQRLLVNAHKTYDGVYKECLLFLMAQESPEPIEKLGGALAALFSIRSDDEESGQPYYTPPLHMAVEYRVHVGHVRGYEPGTAGPNTPLFNTPYSRIVFSAVPDARYFRAIEYVGNPHHRRGYSDDDAFSKVTETYSGTLIALSMPGTYLALLRSFLSHDPKIYFLTDANLFRDSNPPILDGDALSHDKTGQGNSVFDHLRVLLRPSSQVGKNSA